MALSTLTGSRLREQRLALGLRQAAVAEAAQISASYLNLIEHNRRNVTGDTLERLAHALGLTVAELTETTGGTLVEDLRAAVSQAAEVAGPELDRIEDFAGRFPGWAKLLVQYFRRSAGLERTVEVLNDRMMHDPHLSVSLHEVLSAVSSVRSTAEILAETDDIDAEWRARFHRNLFADSERLAIGAEALVSYLDGSEEKAELGVVAPQEEVEAWFADRGWSLDQDLPAGGVEAEIDRFASQAARSLGHDLVRQVRADMVALPLQPFLQAIADHGADPARLAARFGVDVVQVFRRLALHPGSGFGLVTCDASGAMLFRKPIEGFAMPRFGSACALWPLYTALARPMTPVQAVVETAGRGERRFSVLAYCAPAFPQGFAGPEIRTAAMLIVPDQPDPRLPAVAIGSSCRICPRAECPARREPTILSAV